MNILTIDLLFSTLVFAITAKIHLIPKLPELEPRFVVLPILLLHALRHLDVPCPGRRISWHPSTVHIPGQHWKGSM
jgi:hypothetical protein